jgi:hypothetical protein
MNKKIFYIHWKGKESGAFSKKEILDMLNVGKIGYLHKIRTKSTRWQLIKDVNLDEIESAEQQNSKNKSDYKTDYFAIILYSTAGLSFLSLWILSVSLALSTYAYLMNDKKNAIGSLIFALIISLSGFFFFETIFPAISE